jgi:hypothetical protein
MDRGVVERPYNDGRIGFVKKMSAVDIEAERPRGLMNIGVNRKQRSHRTNRVIELPQTQ